LGQSFFSPIGIENIHGPVLPPLRDLWYSPLVKPLVGFCLVEGLYLFFKYRCYRLLFRLFREKRFPLLELVIAFLAIALSGPAEHNYLHLLGNRCELLEEILELLSYSGLLITQLAIFSQTKSDQICCAST
jgi:hypothetical protein